MTPNWTLLEEIILLWNFRRLSSKDSTYEIQVSSRQLWGHSPLAVVAKKNASQSVANISAELLPQYLPSVHRGMTRMTLIFKRSHQKLEACGGLTSTKFPRKKWTTKNGYLVLAKVDKTIKDMTKMLHPPWRPGWPVLEMPCLLAKNFDIRFAWYDALSPTSQLLENLPI